MTVPQKPQWLWVFVHAKHSTSQSKPPEDWLSVNLLWEIAEMDDGFEMDGLPAKSDERNKTKNHIHTLHIR